MRATKKANNAALLDAGLYFHSKRDNTGIYQNISTHITVETLCAYPSTVTQFYARIWMNSIQFMTREKPMYSWEICRFSATFGTHEQANSAKIWN